MDDFKLKRTVARQVYDSADRHLQQLDPGADQPFQEELYGHILARIQHHPLRHPPPFAPAASGASYVPPFSAQPVPQSTPITQEGARFAVSAVPYPSGSRSLRLSSAASKQALRKLGLDLTAIRFAVRRS